MNKTTWIKYYEVKAPEGQYGLAETFETFEDAIKGGKRMNESETSLGYKPSKWIVTKTEIYREWDSDGTFVSETKNTIGLSVKDYV